MWRVVRVGLAFALVVIGCMAAMPAEEKPLFVKGQIIDVIWDCAPAYGARLVSSIFAGGQPISSCYGERLTVLGVHKNGWVDVEDDTKATWTINPARMQGFTVADDHTLRAAR